MAGVRSFEENEGERIRSAYLAAEEIQARPMVCSRVAGTSWLDGDLSPELEQRRRTSG